VGVMEPTMRGIRNWAPPGMQLFFPGLRSDTFLTGRYAKLVIYIITYITVHRKV
jgi:hypothetical protein